MTSEELAEKVSKLPKWAREHIERLARQRDTAVHALDEYTDDQKPSAFYTDDAECTGEKRGPTFRRRNIQAHRIICEANGVWLEIGVPQIVRDGINIQWGGEKRFSITEAAFIPESYQRARIVAKENMR